MGLARVGLGLAGFVVFLLVWQAMLWLGIASDRVLAYPSTLFAFLASRPALGELWHAALASAWQFAASFGIAGLLGLVAGVGLGWYRRVGALLEPLLAATNAVPLIAVIPLLVIILGLGAATELVIVGVFAFFPVYFAVSSAAAVVDAQLVRMCRSFGGSELRVLTGIVLPSVVPAIISGLRLGIGRALTALVVVELFMGRGGLGSIIIDSVNQGRPNLALLAVVMLGAANLVASGLLQLLQNSVEVWRPGQAAR
jgi:ABC-type nitrate/sulfonate/bicarbonate transport system permease component